MTTIPSAHLRVIEFVGLPGAGKTTILKEFRQHVLGAPSFLFDINDLKPSPRDRLPRLGKVFSLLSLLLFFATHARLYREMLLYGFRARRLSLQMFYKVFSYIRVAYFIDVEKKRQREDCQASLLLDQGLVQAIGSMSVPSSGKPLPSPKRLVDILVMKRVDMIIFLECDMWQALERIKQRSHGGSRFDIGARTPLKKLELGRMESALRRTVNECKLAGIHVLTISSKQAVDKSVAQIRHWLIDEVAAI